MYVQGGDAFAIFVLGCFVLQGARGLVPNQQRYAELMREAADAGLALAQMNLGTCYEFGRGVARVDYAMAARYYRLAAAQGLDLARFRSALDQHTHAARIRRDMAAADATGASIGTPAFFIAGRFVAGALPVESVLARAA